ncbi:MAG: hypothetical protein AAGH99_16215 [Planctomycetota bacterium]
MHYGQDFLDGLRKRSLYGQFFSYQQYQDLKQSETADAFALALGETSYAAIPVYPEPVNTFKHFMLVQKQKECFQWFSQIGGLDLFIIVLIPLIPFLLLWSLIRYRAIGREIKQLKAQYLK